MAMPLTAIDPLVPLLKVTVWVGLLLPTVWLPKLSEAGVTVTLPPLLATPLPVSATVRGLPASEVLIVTLPVRVPLAVGVKVTNTWQLPPALRVVGNGPMPQLFCWLEAAPMAMPLTVID